MWRKPYVAILKTITNYSRGGKPNCNTDALKICLQELSATIKNSMWETRQYHDYFSLLGHKWLMLVGQQNCIFLITSVLIICRACLHCIKENVLFEGKSFQNLLVGNPHISLQEMCKPHCLETLDATLTNSMGLHLDVGLWQVQRLYLWGTTKRWCSCNFSLWGKRAAFVKILAPGHLLKTWEALPYHSAALMWETKTYHPTAQGGNPSFWYLSQFCFWECFSKLLSSLP